jgi:F0F1-type ATP synthase membrane subunit b/b'
LRARRTCPKIKILTPKASPGYESLEFFKDIRNMDAVLNIIQALGIDRTLFIQLPIFLVMLFSIKAIAFNKYYECFEEREKQTVGGQEEALEFLKKTEELETTYQQKARALNTEIKGIFDARRLDAQKEHERIIVEAKDRVRSAVESGKSQIQGEFNKAREELLRDSKTIGRAIADRMLSREA